MSETCEFSIDDRIFPLPAVLKTAYLYLDLYYVHMEYKSEHNLFIEITGKEGGRLPKSLSSTFSNDLIAQVTRHSIANSERNIRELILGRALYSTCFETEDIPVPSEIPSQEFNIDDIAVSWKGNE